MAGDIVPVKKVYDAEFEDIKENGVVHRCATWPELAEEHNNDGSSEYFWDIILKNILDYSKQYQKDFESSVWFVRNFKMPPNHKLVKKCKSGCLVCHHDLIPERIHYLMLKGYCDLRTLQYYLFSKGIFFKEWYLKQHLKHINIKSLGGNDDASPVIEDTVVLEEQIAKIRKELEAYEEIGGVEENRVVLNLRDQLMKLIDAKRKISTEDKANESAITWGDFLKRYKDSKTIEVPKE